jgi:hypothetical protein
MASMQIPTPDGSGQAVHPDVLHVPGGFLGYDYWMGCTPYPFAADRLENPIVRVSQDGLAWQPFPGAPDPLVQAPADSAWHHADTDIVLHQGTLYVFFISTNREAPGTTFSFVCTRDGKRWSAPQEIYRAAWGVSPAVVADVQGRWRLWYVVRDALARSQSSQVLLATGSGPGQWEAATACMLSIPGYVVWHLDVVAVETGFEALVTAFPGGTDPSRSRLFLARSADGLTFTLAGTTPLVRPSWLGWDNRMIYRSTMVVLPGGVRRIWYSGASWGMRTGIGLLEGLPGGLRRIAAPAARAGAVQALRENLSGLAKYLLYRVLPPGAYSGMLRLRNRTRALLGGR